MMNTAILVIKCRYGAGDNRQLRPHAAGQELGQAKVRQTLSIIGKKGFKTILDRPRLLPVRDERFKTGSDGGRGAAT